MFGIYLFVAFVLFILFISIVHNHNDDWLSTIAVAIASLLVALSWPFFFVLFVFFSVWRRL